MREMIYRAIKQKLFKSVKTPRDLFIDSIQLLDNKIMHKPRINLPDCHSFFRASHRNA